MDDEWEQSLLIFPYFYVFNVLHDDLYDLYKATIFNYLECIIIIISISINISDFQYSRTSSV